MRLAPLILLLACKGPEAEPGEGDPVLLQAIDGAFSANSEVHPQLPLRIEMEGAQSVTVRGPGGEADAFEEEEGVWLAWLTTGEESGTVTVTAAVGEEERTTSAELVVANEGVQLTNLDEVGTVTTPSLLRSGGALWGTWCDRREELAQCWAQRLDGAGRFTGDIRRISLEAEDTLYARTAMGEGTIGVLYQVSGGQPYLTYLRVVDTDGEEVLASTTVHEDGWQGTFGGDIHWDGSAFTMVWRERSTTTVDSRIRWQRVTTGGVVTGPITVAESGESDPDGGFDPFVFIKTATLDGANLVTYVQQRYDAQLDIEVPKARFAVLNSEGTLLEEGSLGSLSSFDWDLEAHAGVAKGQLIALWSKDDLGSLEDTIPTEIAVRTFLTTGDPIELGASVEQAPDTRGEMALFDHAGHRAAMAWIDHRTYTEKGVENGQIQLHVAALTDTLQSRPALVYPHARFFAGMTDLGGVLADHNVLLTWRDQRRDFSTSEMYFETAWIAP